MAHLLDKELFFKNWRTNSDSNFTLPKGRRAWQNVSITDFQEDNGLLVTNINQTQDLLRLRDTAILFAGLKATDNWVKVYGLENKHLTLENLIKKVNVVLNASDGTEHIEFTKEVVHDFETQLLAAIDMYDKRIQWLLQGSRKMFGVIQGSRIGVLIDTSNISCKPRLCEFQRDLLSLIDEQLCYMKKLYFVSFGTEASSLWEQPQAISVNVLHEARQWVQDLKPSGGCNLLKALKKALVIKELDSLVIIVGSCPDQSSGILSDYIQQCTVGRNLVVHTVTYDCSSQVPPDVVKSMAEDVGGSYHCYSTKREDCDSSDLQLVLCECQKANHLLNIINQIYQGKMVDSLFNFIKCGSIESLQVSSVISLPKPPQHESPLVIQSTKLLAKSSAEWLKTYGLKAKKLSLYRVLAPNAFSPVEEFVPVLQKTVSSTLHEKVMTQFEWHDGTVKNVHVDPPVLYDYQKQLGRIVRMYERRIDWLSIGSRRIWGAVGERRVVILVDVSQANSIYIIHIQHSLRLLLEEQMSSKDCFNIIAFGSSVKAWQPEMVPPHPDNLQSAWKWVLTLQCEGTRNVMNALRRAVEVDLQEKDKHESQSIYLLTTGVPDQEMHAVCSYMTEVCGGCNLQLHVCLFSVNGFPFDEDIPPRYASPNETAAAFKEIVQFTNGRFHWFGETGIYESDDISLILSEMEKAVSYSHKCALLVESLRQRTRGQLGNQSIPEEDLEKQEKKSKPQKLSSPKPTALSLARMSLRDHHDGDRNGSMKALLWRPPSANPEIPSVQSLKDVFLLRRKHNSKSKKHPDVSLSLFYTDKGKNVGAVYKKYSNPKCLRKLVPKVILPQEEEICSSKEWLSKFSLKKLKLELPSLIFGPESRHQKHMVGSLHKQVSAKYCDIFPSVEMHGIVKHLQVQLKDLEDYIEQMEKVLRCYVRRLQWLLSGSRRLFGVILEANVCLLIDTSGSMDRSLEQVTKELTSLIWEQLRKNNTKFNLISFAEDVEVWQECLVEATDEACHDATQWVSVFRAHGNTSILKALWRAFSLQDIEALYILTDGKPDTSCNLVLKEIEILRKKRAVTIHTISFNCTDRGANDFLKKLAFRTGGRYHQCHGDVDGQLAAHRLLSEGFKDEDDPVFPLFEGDDLKKLAEEIAKARSYLTQARFFKSLLEKRNSSQKRQSS
ncbi:von Willebrand factor A domain-containing protein 3A isoform X1 [Sceloporus undulatus]|uniref:von Willebrand factor A domain-containing protein 3A isoform X1 n=1 Tax=Sceloporus undulatus TaxID=8520 RepID=UPI001C4B0B73|nr:von Willebrand factor A domain-containing protein 3A isoform X1 [Sceloporus undulatus]XP_042293165.1 von Willebrand factor A domain-containing protein 3A isoform X1 [Sceloporus undulatus]